MHCNNIQETRGGVDAVALGRARPTKCAGRAKGALNIIDAVKSCDGGN